MEIPQDIVKEVRRKFVDYYWVSSIFDCTPSQFKFIIMSCVKEINDNAQDDNPSIHVQTVIHLLQTKQMDGAGFCSLGKKRFCFLMQRAEACSMGIGIKLWRKIYEYNLSVIPIGTPIYIPFE